MKIEDSIRIILTLNNRIKRLYKQFTIIKLQLEFLDNISLQNDGHHIPCGKHLSGTTTQMMFLTNQSMLEEYHKFLQPSNFPDYKTQIEKFKQETKPAIIKLNKWRDKDDFRNSYVAHNLRTKRNMPILNQKTSLNIPHYDNDFVVIYYINCFITSSLQKNFPKEVSKIINSKYYEYINYIGKHTPLKEDLEIIKSWFDQNNIKTCNNELEKHIKSLENKE